MRRGANEVVSKGAEIRPNSGKGALMDSDKMTDVLSSPDEPTRALVGKDAVHDLRVESDEGQAAPKNTTRRALIAVVAVLGVCGTAAALGVFLFPKHTLSYKGLVSYDPSEDENLLLSEASTVRPERAIPQGELATITAGNGSGDTLAGIFFEGTIRLRVAGAWLYKTGEAFERAEGIGIETNPIDSMLMEQGEKLRVEDESDPEKAEEARAQRQKMRELDACWITEPERVEDLQVELDKRRTMLYTDDYSMLAYTMTTQVLLDAGYKLLVFDLEYENVNAQAYVDGKSKNQDLLYLPSLARGSDMAVWEMRFYLFEGEDEPSLETYEETGNTFERVLVPRGEKRLIHVVYAVSPRSLKGELSLCMGEPMWQPTVPDDVVLLALDPDLVS